MEDLPIEHCYWVVPGVFLAGEYPRNLDETSSRAKLDALVGAGVRTFVDLTEDRDGLLPYVPLLLAYRDQGVSHRRFPVADQGVPVSRGFAAGILDAIDEEIAKGQAVYLHCWGGIGRTGTIVGCWLARQGLAGSAALHRLAQLWQHCPKSRYRRSPENELQERFIKEWQEQ